MACSEQWTTALTIEFVGALGKKLPTTSPNRNGCCALDVPIGISKRSEDEILVCATCNRHAKAVPQIFGAQRIPWIIFQYMACYSVLEDCP